MLRWNRRDLLKHFQTVCIDLKKINTSAIIRVCLYDILELKRKKRVGRTRFGRKTLLTYLPRSVTRLINLE